MDHHDADPLDDKNNDCNNDDDDDTMDTTTNPRGHARLRAHPIVWATVGVIQTLLTAGVVFGWASLLPVLREEEQEQGEGSIDFSAQAYSQIFTIGAVGNYISTVFFGAILDHYGPRWTGTLASTLFAVGLILLCTIQQQEQEQQATTFGRGDQEEDAALSSSSTSSTYTRLAIGFGLLGFSGPGVQMPTLHLANLFAGEAKEGGSGGGAIFMSAQAAAFDGGTAVFAILRFLFYSDNDTFSLSSSRTFFAIYLMVPIWVFVTSIFVWPDDILEKLESDDDDDDGGDTKKYVGIGSPYLSPARLSGSMSSQRRTRTTQQQQSLVNAPLSVILRKPAFYALAIWTSVHILKLNFVVATINDQLMDLPPDSSSQLMDIFGAMLPFGFVALPLVAQTLSQSAFQALQLANIVGILYGTVLLLAPTNFWLLTICVFPFVATSRQLVYSTVFSQIGDVFGFANYGMLLGLINISVSGFSTIQTPLVDWAESVGTYAPANFILLVVTLPLFGIAYFADPKMTTMNTMMWWGSSSTSSSHGGGVGGRNMMGENMPLLKRNKDTDSERSQPIEGFQRPRGMSEGGVV